MNTGHGSIEPIIINFLSKIVTVRTVKSQSRLYSIAIDSIFAGYFDIEGSLTNIPTDLITAEQKDQLIQLISDQLQEQK
jgi:hypothetical protein